MKGKSRFSVAGNEAGATAVEFSVVVVLLLIILFGILELGFIFLQKHYVANAAREGVRIGVRANNFDTFTPLTNNPAGISDCDTTTNRASKVDCEVRAYLGTLYTAGDVKISVAREAPQSSNPSVPDGQEERLDVTVTVPNFFPTLLSGLVPGFGAPNQFIYTASGDYEDPEEALTEYP